MSHSWFYQNDDYSDEWIELTAENAAADDEPFTPIIKTNLSFDAFDEASANGVLLDACAAEILRMDRRIKELEAHQEGMRKTLRIECGDLGDNDWDDDLHLGDVIEKHLCRPAAGRIAELEAEPARIRRELLESVGDFTHRFTGTHDHDRSSFDVTVFDEDDFRDAIDRAIPGTES
jgi:hypothetical protein